ncbi:MAG: hypothetical protein Q6K12_00135 [Gloeomargarita sp. DG_1_6_bins_138]
MTASMPRDMTSLLTHGYQVKIGDYISRGWELLQPKIGLFISYTALLAGINVFLAFIPIPLLGGLVSFIVSPALNAGLFIVAYKHLLGESVEFSDFFKGFERLGVFFMATWLRGLFTTVGILLLIVPGIYLWVAYIFVELMIIDQNLNWWPAMEMSRQLITRKFFPMFGFLLLLVLINFGGALLCGLGLLVTVPLTCCALTVAYVDIMNQGEGGGGTFG